MESGYPKTRSPFWMAFALLATLAVTALSWASEPSKEAANALLSRQKFTEGISMLQRLAVQDPADAGLLKELSLAHFMQAAFLKDLAAQKTHFDLAVGYARKAKEMGIRSEDLDRIIAVGQQGFSEDTFKPKGELEKLFLKAETALQSQDYDGAIAVYHQILAEHPDDYRALVYCGDAYFCRNDLDTAIEWYAKAAAIQPDEDVAYRFWADALMRQGKFGEAREKILDGVIARPFSNRSWEYLDRWCKKTGKRFSLPFAFPPYPRKALAKPENRDKILVSEEIMKNPAEGAFFLIYQQTKTDLLREKTPELPAIQGCGRELGIESAAIRRAAKVLEAPQDGKDVPKPSWPETPNVLIAQDLLEAYIFLARADPEIQDDYPEYRKVHRPRLKTFLERCIQEK